MSEMISFSVNGAEHRMMDAKSSDTLLDFLRNDLELTGTKEGCNEGDCGACTVLVSEASDGVVRHKAINACIMFLPQVHGKSVRTVESAANSDGSPNCIQQALIECHASQCGFCTPGFVMSLVAGHLNRDSRHDDVVAGNLCRCTGYAPIVRAAKDAFGQALPAWTSDFESTLPESNVPVRQDDFYVPSSLGEFADWYLSNPSATIVAGATDVGLWVTKQLRSIDPACFIADLQELREVKQTRQGWLIGSCVTLSEMKDLLSVSCPSLAELLRRFGSVQVRNSATIGGNVANGSPIGDASPALIALDASLILRRGKDTRQISVEDFFIDYGRQDIGQGEFIEAILVPEFSEDLRCYKVSKRFDQDISAVCGCFRIHASSGTVRSARIAFGGMAATPKRASLAEAALVGQPWEHSTVQSAMDQLAKDYQPISDMRASADYRMETARNLLLRYFLERTAGEVSLDILEVNP